MGKEGLIVFPPLPTTWPLGATQKDLEGNKDRPALGLETVHPHSEHLWLSPKHAFLLPLVPPLRQDLPGPLAVPAAERKR